MEYPRHLRDRDDVDYREQTDVLDPEEFEVAADRDIDGGVVVGVANDDGEVLLVQNDWSDGWLLPGGGVEPGEDWEEAARREAEEETGVAVELDGIELVMRGELVNAETGERLPPGWAVFYRASPTGDESVAEDPGVADEDIAAVDWFSEVPADVDPNHRNDVRRFLE